jgi:hypothetical protein
VAPLRSHSDPIRERWVDTPDGFQIQYVQSCKDTLRAVHDAAELIPRKTKADGATFSASVNMVQALAWAKECGCPMGTREWIAYAKTKLNGDFSKFKVQR